MRVHQITRSFRPLIKIGLTGGIGSGKSTAADILGSLGADVIDADQVSRYVYEPDKDGFAAVINTFGVGIVGADGKIDRRALGQQVFATESARRRLEIAVWPVMEDEFRRRFTRAAKAGTSVVCLEAAILFEAKWNALVDEVWVITASKERVLSRLLDRDGLNEQQVTDRLNAQLPVAQKIKLADVVIENDSSIDHLQDTMTRAWFKMISRYKKPR